MPAARPPLPRPARRAGLAVVASVLAAVALPPATAAGPAAAPAAVERTTAPVVVPAEAPVSVAAGVRVAVGAPLASVVAPVASVVAPVATPAAPTGDRWEVVGAAASARLVAAGLDPAGLGYEVDYLPGRSGYRGLTYPVQRRIEMYVRADHDVDDVLRVLVHELGHAVSETCLDAAERDRYQQVRGLGGAWYPSAHSGASGTEDHAEVFAWSVLGGLADMRSTGGGAPSAGELATLRAEGLLAPC